MDSLTRTKRAVRGEPVDRTPVFPILLAPACRIAGVNFRDYLTDSAVMAETLLENRDIFDFDGIYVSRDNWVYHQALGGELEFPDDDETFSRTPLLPRLAEFRSLTVPDPWHASGMETVLAAAKQIVGATGNRYYIQANIDTGPFSLAAVLRGAERFMMDLYDASEADLHDFLAFCTDVVVAYGEAMIDTGVHAIQMGDATAGLLSDSLFARFALPYLSDALERLSGHDCDLWVHICGNTTHLLPTLAQLPMDGFEVDSLVDLTRARETLGSKIAVKGNIDTSFLLQATADEVYTASIELLRSGPFDTGLVLSPGCAVPKMTPPENIVAMVQAAKDYEPGSSASVGPAPRNLA